MKIRTRNRKETGIGAFKKKIISGWKMNLKTPRSTSDDKVPFRYISLLERIKGNDCRSGGGEASPLLAAKSISK